MRMTPEMRKTELMDHAVRLAKDPSIGYYNVRREQLAKAAGVAPALVNHYYGTVKQLQRDILRRAIHLGVAAIVAQGRMRMDPVAITACEANMDLRDAVDQYLRGVGV